MKRLFAMMIAGVSAISVLAGCGASDAATVSESQTTEAAETTDAGESA